MFKITFDATTLHLCYQSFCLVCVRYSVLVIISQKEALVSFSSVAFTNLQHSDENKPNRIRGLKNGGWAQTHSYGFRGFHTNVLCTTEINHKDNPQLHLQMHEHVRTQKWDKDNRDTDEKTVFVQKWQVLFFLYTRLRCKLESFFLFKCPGCGS